MIKQLTSLVDRALIKAELVEKQRLFAQMVKDNIAGQVKDSLSEEIGKLNTKLYARSK